MKKNPSSLLLPAALLLASCSTPYQPAKLMEDGAQFPGMVGIAATSREKVVDVLIVHGMCNHDVTWANQTIDRLIGAIDVNAVRETETKKGLISSRGDIEIVPRTVKMQDVTFRFNALVWSPLTALHKQQLCYDQTNKSPLCQGQPSYTPQRASLNAKIKDSLLNDCLADVLVYQGAAREEIQRRMREAILRATAEPGSLATLDAEQAGSRSATQTTPLIVISESLGSKIVFDTLLRMTMEPASSLGAAAAQRTLDRMTLIFMGANQIPLLGLADHGLTSGNRVDQPVAPAIDTLQHLLQKRQRPSRDTSGLVQRMAIVAFTDPNDLLSYTLQPSKYEGDGISVINVLVSNDWTYFGALERPDYAHEHYHFNQDVERLISCGQPKSSHCK